MNFSTGDFGLQCGGVPTAVWRLAVCISPVFVIQTLQLGDEMCAKTRRNDKISKKRKKTCESMLQMLKNFVTFVTLLKVKGFLSGDKES